MGVDLGSRRIGLALSDRDGVMASPLTMIERSARRAEDHARILELAEEHGVSTVVVGLPLTMDGEVGTAARRTLSEVDELRRLADGRVVVEVHDERLTTVSAESALIEAGMRRQRRRQAVDKVAAAVLLQDWLDRRRGRGRP